MESKSKNYNLINLPKLMFEVGITITTVDSETHAKDIIKNLLSKKLVACGQIDKISSIYYWKNEIFEDNEYRLMLKHPIDTVQHVLNELKENHPYEIPEVITSEFKTTEEYSKWITDSCS